MRKEVRLNAVVMNSPSNQIPASWRFPDDRGAAFVDLEHWTEIAQTLERGLFDSIFLADVLGIYDVYAGDSDAAIRNAVQVPINDPSLVVPAMAAVTKNLGFGITANVSQEKPYMFARKMSTLDHLTKGRVAWNIVTGYLESGAKAAGQKAQVGHDTRYEIADEFLDLMYKLWEGSWEEGSVLQDLKSGDYADPSRVHKVSHHGSYFDLEGIHLSQPSPQRTPILFQAGASPRGQAFAAKHGECIFITGKHMETTANVVANFRRRAVQQGRKGSDLLIYSHMCVIVGETTEEALHKEAHFRRYAKAEGALALLSGFTGIDFSAYSLDDPITHLESKAVLSVLDGFLDTFEGVPTINDIVDALCLSGPGPLVVGSPKHVVDEMERWMNVCDVDGFNISYVTFPNSFVDIVDLVVPELQRRGLYRTEYQGGTLREKLFGRGPYLELPHAGAKFRSRGTVKAT